MDDMLRNIEYLREKADVSYEEAADLLERYDGNVMRALVELEHQGRVYAQSAPERGETARPQPEYSQARERANTFINKAMATKLIVEKRKDDGSKETVVNVNAPLAAGVAVFAPWLTLATAGLAFVTGHSVKIKQEKPDQKDAD